MRIKQLKLFSGNIEKQKIFYQDKLGLKIEDSTESSFSVRVGNSMLFFEARDGSQNYHFAFDIPSNQINQSFEWMKERVDLLAMGNENIIKFPSWNAEAIYFRDQDANIVEFIARKNLNNESSRPFRTGSFISISEVGMPTSNVSQVSDTLRCAFNLHEYSADGNRFCAVGDELGLFIIIDYKQKKWIPTMDDAYPYPFEILFENNQGIQYEFKYENEILVYEST